MQVETAFPSSDGTPMPGVLTVPDDGDGPVPGLLMIYEIFGMSDEMRRIARDLAADGYAVLIPDLFDRGPVRTFCVAATMRAMLTGHGPAMDDLEAAASFGGRDLGMRGAPEKLTADLEALDVPHDVKVYPEAGHSFFTRTPGLTGRVVRRLPIHAEYHEANAQDAHRRVLAFFREHLASS